MYLPAELLDLLILFLVLFVRFQFLRIEPCIQNILISINIHLEMYFLKFKVKSVFLFLGYFVYYLGKSLS